MATTWTAVNGVVAKCVCSTETGAAPTLVTDGLSLKGLRKLYVSYRADSGNLTAGKTLDAYVWNPYLTTAAWTRCKDMDLTVGVAAGTAGWLSLDVEGCNSLLRLAYVPTTIGQAGTVWMIGSN